jgi:hypothetical protein
VRPAFSHVCASACGRYAAALTPAGLHTFGLDWTGSHVKGGRHLATRRHAPHPAPPTHVTALAFTCGHAPRLAVATSDAPLVLFDVEALAPAAWLQAHAALSKKLAAVDGHVEFLACQPQLDHASEQAHDRVHDDGGYGCIVVASRRMFCIVQLDRVRAGVEVAGWGIERRVRAKLKPVFAGDPPDGPARLCNFRGIALGVAWAGERELIVAEGDPRQARAQLPPPLEMRVYGE